MSFYSVQAKIKRVNQVLEIEDTRVHKETKVKSLHQETVIHFKQQGDVTFKILFKSQSQYLNFDLRVLLANRLTPLSFSIGCADGYLAKDEKSMGSHFLTKE